jgi:MFS superfamily sulfate permease-like transporter
LTDRDRSQVRWLAVAGTGLACGVLLGWLLWSLTGNVAAAVVVGIAVAAILVVLAVAGARQNAQFRDDDGKRAQASARIARAQQALRETRGDTDAERPDGG